MQLWQDRLSDGRRQLPNAYDKSVWEVISMLLLEQRPSMQKLIRTSDEKYEIFATCFAVKHNKDDYRRGKKANAKPPYLSMHEECMVELYIEYRWMTAGTQC